MAADFLRQLNPQQHNAVTARERQVLVLAGPGSGKTRVLTQRIAYLMYENRVPPSNILAVTFTNKAAREMRGRLERMVGSAVHALWMGTFHGICARILRQEAQYLPFDKNYVIMDADDQRAIVKRALKDLNLDPKLHPPAAVHNAISNAKNKLISAEGFQTRTYREEVAKRVYEKYERSLRNSNAVDFDDLLRFAVELMEREPEVRAYYSHQFTYVLVDEFQDTNLAQYDLLKHLASQHHNLYVVGDEDQSIYRWRGADYRNILRFEKDFPQSKKYLLEQNYRSTQNILDAAQAVINQNHSRTPKSLVSNRGKGVRLTLQDAADEHAEAAYVVHNIAERMENGENGGNIAVMYRTNAQSRLFEEAFLRSGMPYRLVGAQRFYGRREVKDLIAYLRLVHNPFDMISLRRVINTPTRGIGSKTIAELESTAVRNGVHPADILSALGKGDHEKSFTSSFNGRAKNVLGIFGSLLNGWSDLSADHSLPDVFDRIIADIGYQEYLHDGTEVGESRWENVLELRQLAFDLDQQGLTAFLENVALVSDQDTLPETLEAPTLLTLHAAKGLEFSTVYIVGLDDGILPHNRSFDEPEEMEEERRLFYVGITRAKNSLIFVRAGQRSNYGRYEYTMPSRFLEDIPEDLVRQEGVRLGVHRVNPLSQPRWQPNLHTGLEEKKSEQKKKAAYQAGMRVVHPTWGDGLVIETRVLGDDETVTVIFESVGLKKLAASLAKLEIVS